MDEVFKAINDPSRRLLLDKLYERDGQTLGELCAYLPEMTRFGVMSHLKILEEAELVTTRKQGRQKFHYLNPVPIRLIHDRWILADLGSLGAGLVTLSVEIPRRLSGKARDALTAYAEATGTIAR